MNKIKISLLIMISVFATSGFATFLPEESIAPSNELPKGASNISKEQFDMVIKDLSSKYSSAVSQFGGKLSISGDWKSEKINAGARQMMGTWQVVITGGLARRPELTLDGMTLIVCHELGHHLAGFPFAKGPNLPLPVPGATTWAANEGQADYYATHVCADNVWGQDKAANAGFRKTASEEVRNYCDSVWLNTDDQNLCYRNLVAAESVALTMATLMKKETMPRFDTPDKSAVNETSDKHPDAQCRMDTSLQGALCAAGFDQAIIPGKNVSSGVDSVDAEREAFQNSCSVVTGFDIGQRPGCWFKSRIN